MPLYFQHNINQYTQLVVWHIQEPESFFILKDISSSHINHSHNRLQHIAGRFLLSYLADDFPYHQLIIDDFGKPVLKNHQYHFSISHAQKYVAVIMSSKNIVGIDIEIVQPKVLKILNKFLSEEEQRNVQINNEKDATLCWTIKEAVYKCYSNYRLNLKKDVYIIEWQENKIAQVKIKIDNEIVKSNVYLKTFDNIILAWIIQ